MFVSASIWRVIALSATTILIVQAEPICKFNGKQQTDLVCTPGNGDYVLRRGLVSDNNKTTRITLRGCRITDIELESFEGLFGLQYLDLSANNIRRLELGVLDEAKQVTSLNLSYNMLTDFPLGLFDEKPNLEILDLKGNRIHLLELGIFDTLTNLKHVDLSSNSILGKNFNVYIFDQSIHIEIFDLSKNDMSGTPDNVLKAFSALDILNLDKCSLTEVPEFATATNLKTMRKLLLSGNQISKIDNPNTFINLDKTEILNLAENIIERVNENVFKSLQKLKMIVLRKNRLRNIPETLFQGMTKLNSIDLSHNLIEFVPVNAFRGTSVKNLNLADNRFTYLTNNFCLELKNSGANLLKFYFNQNPWQCACLKEALNEVKKMGIGYNAVKYNGKEPVCVTTNKFYCMRHQSSNNLYIEMYSNLVNK